MTIKRNLCISLFCLTFLANSQNFSGVYKIDRLLSRVNNPDTAYIINFWATWCKPCIEELPAFDSLLLKNKTNVKIILVSLDFKEDLEKKVKPFLLEHQVKAECILLDEVNGNDFVNKISPSWSGAIPATLFKKGKKKELLEKKIKLSDLLGHLEALGKK
jgi:thiol-disulfide isomerase/thioredoxin